MCVLLLHSSQDFELDSHTIVVWEVFSNSSVFQAKLITFHDHEGSVDQLCWHKTDPELLCTAGGDKTVRIWDARKKKCFSTINTRG